MEILKFPLLLILLFLVTGYTDLYSQAVTLEPLPFGSMDHWRVREIKESGVIGGQTKLLYEIGTAGDTLRGNIPYRNPRSPWATSSVYARIKGINKGIVNVFPEPRYGGNAARLETRVDQIKVLGVVNINVLVSGTIFLGEMVEPITDTGDPYSKLVAGVPFTRKPAFLQYDYKVRTGGQKRKINGLSSTGQAMGERDMAEVQILLQKRWEDENGNVYARRIGTGWERFEKSVENWQNKHKLTVQYGDITKTSYYRDFMGLRVGEGTYYTKNSKGKIVPIIENGWGSADDEVTHLIVQFSSSNGEPFIGCPESRLWVDNISLGYID